LSVFGLVCLIVNFWLILPKFEKTSLNQNGQTVKKSLFSKLLTKKSVWVFSLLILFFVVAGNTQASIWSVVGNLFNSTVPDNKEDPADLINYNSQNLALVEPLMNTEATTSSKAETDLPMVGGSAVLSEAGPMGTLADIKDNVPPSDLISVYTVHKGDKIDDVAKMFNVSANTIRWANDLKKGVALKEGDNLIILPVTGVQYVVKKGDTVKSIAKKYSGDAEEIISYNDLDPTGVLTAGDTIIIPDGEIGTPITSGNKPVTKPGKYTGPSYAGYYMRPISGGKRSQGVHGHNAVDLAAPNGTPIYAAASGKVIIAKSSGYNGGYGEYVAISHPNGTQTLYGHMSVVLVSSGQRVDKGDIIGRVGSTGRSTGNHVHFEIRGASNPF